MKLKKRLKTIKQIENLSIKLDYNIFDVLPEDVLKQLNPNFSRPTIGFQYQPSTNVVDNNRNKI